METQRKRIIGVTGGGGAGIRQKNVCAEFFP